MTAPFEAFARSLRPQSPLRAAITAAYRRPEPDCVPPLLDLATLTPAMAAKARALALRLVEALRAKVPSGGVEGLIHEYSLSSQEGVALMCLAEALLRIPDDETRDALIRDKIGGGDWRAHLGQSPSLFVNAATWGLDADRPPDGDQQREEPVGGADAAGGEGWRAVDPRQREHRDAPDGRAVRFRPDDRRGAGQRPSLRGRGLPLFLRHAGRGSDHGRASRALPSGLRACDPCHRQGVGGTRHLRGRRHLAETLGAASALQPCPGRTGS